MIIYDNIIIYYDSLKGTQNILLYLDFLLKIAENVIKIYFYLFYFFSLRLFFLYFTTLKYFIIYYAA